MSKRDQFLSRIRQAVAQGNRAGEPSTPPERDGIGYQGAGDDLVQTFFEELKAVGGMPHVVHDRDAAVQMVLKISAEIAADKVLLGCGPHLDMLNLAAALEEIGKQIIAADQVASVSREGIFAADVGISSVDYLIAETGTIVVSSKPNDPRAVSLLPPAHIAIASREQILPDLFDWIDAMEKSGLENLPSGAALITGPSKTGDIELKLVTGVHGPGEVHVIIID